MAIKGFMARAERAFENTAETPMPLPTASGSAAAAPAARTVAPSTSIDASTELEGKLRCKQTLRIDGRIKGELECDKTVLVGEGAKVFASIIADEIQISGLVEGDITARRKITLHRTAVVKGDLTTPGIVIEEGAKLKGRIMIGSDAEATVDAAVEESASARDAKDAAAKRAQAFKKTPSAGQKPGEVPASQPVAASA
jgi:cytoskeletal protein CcmA (bactofilin family)